MTDERARVEALVRKWANDELHQVNERTLTDAILAFAAAQRAEEREAFEKMLAAVEEMPGEMLEELWIACSTRDGAAAVLRATVRATKKELLNTIRARREGPP